MDMAAARDDKPTYAEFFCGGGMVRAGLDSAWDCVLANDIDPMKCAVYARNWGKTALVEGDVAMLDPALLQRPLDMFWGSSPCQDFSLAGKGAGLAGARSGVFTQWADVIERAVQDGFAPRIIAFENVAGLVSRAKGADFTRVLRRLASLGYALGGLEIDAARFIPQSRPRLFVICLRNDLPRDGLTTPVATGPFHSKRLRDYAATAPRDIARNWVWWAHEAPPRRNVTLHQILDEAPDTPLLPQAEIGRLLAMMSAPSQAKLEQARKSGQLEIGTLYKRGRPDAVGAVRQRAEVRFDGVAGCLRTPAGGSSRQTVLLVEGDKTRARLLSTREVARLMGLDDAFAMPQRYNQAYKVAGDGVAVPIVRYLDTQIFRPALALAARRAVA